MNVSSVPLVMKEKGQQREGSLLFFAVSCMRSIAAGSAFNGEAME